MTAMHVPAALAPARRRWTATETQVVVAVAATALLVGLFEVVGRLERLAAPDVERAGRLVRDATETTTRLLAVAHTLVATWFLLTSRRMREPAERRRVAALGALGVALAVGFSKLGGRDSELAMLLFTVYFFLHALRDEAWFYAALGDAPRDEADAAGRRLGGAMLVVLAASFVAAGAVGAARAGRITGLASLPTAARLAVGAAAVAAAAVAVHRLLRGLPRPAGAGVGAGVSRHRPLVVALAAAGATTAASLALTGRFYAVVALHVVAWFVFTVRRLRAAPPSPRPSVGSLAWARTTATGFVVLHVVALLVPCAVAATWALAARNDPSWTAAAALTSRDAFPLWTIVHVTLSWTPRPAAPPLPIDPQVGARHRVAVPGTDLVNPAG